MFAKNKTLTPELISDTNTTGKYLHRFSWLDDNEIGTLSHEWNWLVGWYKEPEDDENYYIIQKVVPGLKNTKIVNMQTNGHLLQILLSDKYIYALFRTYRNYI